ncbi:MAG: hypothetical protein QOJ35_3934 [Solirubrobacteraceae bacterium]|jgi:hypothetical protein|nr:hypothetical protein [Solirubrobacteraceae bacterium]
MGLLDEAIREHLELKRRRGADAGEISREESEALGPVRRAPDGTPDLASIPGPPPTTMAAPDTVFGEAPPADEPEPDWEGETAILPAAPPAPTAYESRPTVAPPPASAPPPPAYQPLPAYEPPTSPGFDDDDEPEPALSEEPPPPPRERSRLLGGGRLRLRRREAPPPEPEPEPDLEGFEPPTAPHQPSYQPVPGGYAPPQQPVPTDDEPAGEDLLEETPEFLEETPDHDRLWFEQRPPRDFDFDK